jgi:hypothetical protein
MNEQELKKAIEAVNNNKFLPEAVKAIKIKKLNTEFEANNKGDENDDKFVAIHESKDGYWTIASKPTSKAKAEKMLGGVPDNEVGKVVTLSEAKAHKKVIGEEYLNKGTKKKTAGRKPRAITTYKGKQLKDLDDAECAELKEAVKARREKQAKSEKKSKTRPVIEKVASNVAQAAKQAIKNIPVSDIKDDPKGEITKMQKLESLTRKYLSDMRSILGEDYDKETIDGEMADIHKIITDLKKKYA